MTMRTALLALAAGAVALLAHAGPTQAGGQTRGTVTITSGAATQLKARTYRKRGVRVRGYAARRGGYSYSSQDVVNTYGLSRSLFGGINSYRDPLIDRQTPAGPFDHDFFFDSGIAPRGGNSPYLN